MPGQRNCLLCGRIDFDNPKAPVLVYAASFVQIRFTGTQISVTLENKRAYWSSRMGYILDGKQGQFLLTSDPGAETYVIARDLEHTEHTLTLKKKTRWGIFKQLVFLCVDDRAESACTVA